MLLAQGYQVRRQGAHTQRSQSPTRSVDMQGQTSSGTTTGSGQNRATPDNTQRNGSPTPSDDLGGSISSLSRRRRSRSPSSATGSEFTEHEHKRLKEEAQQLARVYKIPAKALLDLAESPSVPSMLLNVGAMLIKRGLSEEVNEETNSKASLLSKDFVCAVRARLHLCMLSPNIPGYLNKVNTHLVTFMKSHQGLFRAQPKYFENSDMRTALCSLVSRELSSVRGNIKTALLDSIRDSKNIIDTVQALAGTKSGMEVGSAHWMRCAFLRRQLRIFCVAMAKDTSTINEYFSVYLLPSMEPDLREHIADQLGRSVEDLEAELQLKLEDMVILDTPPSTGTSAGGSNNSGTETGGPATTDGATESDPNDNFFGKDGKSKYTNRDYWNYVDDSLVRLRRLAFKQTADHEAAKKLFVETLTEIFMMDLHEFPGSRRLRELPAPIADRPEWQKIIEAELIWPH